MKIFAIDKSKPGVEFAQIKPLLEPEAKVLWAGYMKGVYRECHYRRDKGGVLLVLECDDVEQAKKHLSELPLVKEGLIEFELFPVGPFMSLSVLFAALTVSFIVFAGLPLVTVYIGIAVHLLMLAIVYALPAPEFGRIAGYVWLLKVGRAALRFALHGGLAAHRALDSERSVLRPHSSHTWGEQDLLESMCRSRDHCLCALFGPMPV